MTIEHRIVSGAVFIRITGRMTLTDGTTVFDDALRRFIDEGHIKLIVDFGDVPYIDSTALGILLRVHATVTRRGGALRLVRVHGHVRQLLDLTRLSDVFETFDSDTQALASVATIPTPRA
jgi:anti-sigma B factor antagonist